MGTCRWIRLPEGLSLRDDNNTEDQSNADDHQAYLEFFVSPALLSPLIRRIERDPRITYYAVNKAGDLRTNTHSEGPNAVTWGVFPGKEIVQPTIVEAVSFIAWK